MPLAGLPLLPDELSTAWLGFVAIFRRNAKLKSIGLQIHSWTGDPTDSDEPGEGNLPWLRMTPQAEESSWGPQRTLYCPMLVEFDIALDGIDLVEGMRFWSLIVSIIYGVRNDSASTATAKAALNAVGISAVDVVKPGYGLKAEAKDNQIIQRFQGIVRLQVFQCANGVLS
jgi:hypothetical protein